MGRLALGLIQKSVFISPSQEEALEAIPGWDDVQATGIIDDDTPSQAAYPENSSQDSLERVFDVTGSSLCSGPSQEAVEFVSPPDVSSPLSPRTTINAVTTRDRGREEDSYNEAFESDRSQYPSRTLSWGFKDPKSPSTSVTNVAAAVEEAEKLPSCLKEMRSEAEASTRASAPPEAVSAAIGLRTELPVDRDARMVEDAEEKSGGRREGFPICEPGGVEARPALSPIGVRDESPLQLSLLPRGTLPLKPSFKPLGEDFGSVSASAFKSLCRKEKRSQSAFSGEHKHHKACGLEVEDTVVARGAASDALVDALDTVVARGAANDALLDTLDKIAISVQVGMQAVRKIVVEDGPSEKVDDRGVAGEINSTHELEAVSRHRVEILSEKEKSKEPLFPPMCYKLPMDATKTRSVDNPGPAAAAHEDGAQSSPPSPLRPPRPVQEKLDKLRSRSGKKRDRSGSGFNLLRDSLKDRDMVSTSAVLEAIRLRSVEGPATEVTAADLIKTALAVGITLPPPFHKNYFCR